MEFVRMTVLVVGGRSGDGDLEIEGTGLTLSCAQTNFGGASRVAAIRTYRKTLISKFYTNRKLEAVSAIKRNPILIVVAQSHIGIFRCMLITQAQGDVRR